MKRKIYMFMENGKVKWWVQGGDKGMIVADDFTMAKKFVDWVKRQQGIKISIAEVGTVAGETLELQVEATLAMGATCTWKVDGFDADDNLLTKIKRFSEYGL